MTAQTFADLVRAKPAGRGRWRALCPSHSDRSPSLDISEGRNGRVLLICRSHGCKPEAIVATLGLTMRDLFSDAPAGTRATRTAMRRTRELREAREAEQRRRAQAARKIADLYRRSARVVDALGAALAYAPDVPKSDEMDATFRRAVRMQQEMETNLGGCGWVKTPPVKPCTWSLFMEPEEEAVEAGRVRTEAQLLRFLATGEAEPKPEPTAQRPVSAGLWEECA